MRSVVVVVDQVLEEFVGEVIEIVEGCSLDEVFVEGAPEALDLSIGLRPIRPCVAVFDAEFESIASKGCSSRLLREANSAPLSDRISAYTSP